MLNLMIDTIVILACVFANAIIGYFQESKAEKSLNSIKNMLSLHAEVKRSGKRTQIDAEDLVIGDIVYLKAGDKVPADIRLLQTNNLKVEELALTGESLAVEKDSKPMEKNLFIGERVNMVFSGTSVVAGTAKGVVVEVGDHTEIGKINRSIVKIEEIKTPLLEQTEKFGKQIGFGIVAFGFVLFVIALFLQDYPLGDLALSVIALIVATIPEGLPAILSILLSIGVQNMARCHAIVKNLPSVETLGSVSVICFDKTGTLTKNEMTVRHVVTNDASYHVTGVGYSPIGKILRDGEEADITKEFNLNMLLLCMKTANDAELVQNEFGEWEMVGDPTDGSLITLSKKGKGNLPNLQKIDKIPFDSAYKYMAVLTERHGEKIIFIKGAPDRLFEMATYQGIEQELFDRAYWEEKVIELAKKGERVLAGAYVSVTEDIESIDHSDLNGAITFLGLTGIIDPPREEAVEAIEACKHAGIRVKMITGDHQDTASAIGKQLGINGLGAIEGRTIDEMSEEKLRHAVQQYDIFARTSPKNKLQIIDALQKNGETVCMTGDGVNDAPSLKKVDIGVAMGIKGTEVSKEAAKMILADDDFSTIFNAVKEGRRVYNNLRKTILFLLPTNFCEAILIAGSILLGFSVILTPVQILWINLITSITISFGLVFEKLDNDALNRPPRPRNASLLSKYYLFRISYVSLIIGGSCIFLVHELILKGFEPAVIQTIVMNSIVFAEMFHLFNCRSELGAALTMGFFDNKVAFFVSGLCILLQIGITYLPICNFTFGTTPLELFHWIYPILIGSTVFFVVELEKWITRTWIDKLPTKPPY